MLLSKKKKKKKTEVYADAYSFITDRDIVRRSSSMKDTTFTTRQNNKKDRF